MWLETIETKIVVGGLHFSRLEEAHEKLGKAHKKLEKAHSSLLDEQNKRSMLKLAM